MLPLLNHSTAFSAAPRFEVFSQNIIGNYHIPGGAEERVEEIEDGVRDNGIDLSGDAFVYFECGSYCLGPVDLEEEEEDMFIASFAVPGSRVYVEGDVDEEGYMDGSIAMKYPRVLPDNKDTEFLNDAFAIDMVHAVPDFTIRHQIQGSSSSPSWNMDELAWETTGEADPCEAEGPYQLWLINKKNLVEGGCDLYTGIACTTTGYVKNLVRSYDESGKLAKVARQEGLLDSL